MAKSKQTEAIKPDSPAKPVAKRTPRQTITANYKPLPRFKSGCSYC